MTTSTRQLVSEYPQANREPDGSLVARVEGSARQYYFFNILGSTQLMAPASENNPTDRFYYTPWGEIVSSGARASTIATTNNPYRYVGQLGYYFHQQDASDQFQGWMQLGVRFYNPVIGRFERVDPIHRAHISDYIYADSNPMIGVDPSGKLTTCHVCVACIGVTLGYAVAGCMDGCRGHECYGKCVLDCLRYLLTDEFFDSLPWWTQMGLGTCVGLCADCGIKLTKPVAPPGGDPIPPPRQSPRPSPPPTQEGPYPIGGDWW